MTIQAKRRTGALLAVLLVVAPATAFGQANCRNTGAFEPWLAAFKKEAAAQGISPAAIAAAAPYLVLDQRIINIDRGQRFFAQNFLEISDKMLAGGRLPNGAAQIKKHQALFAREEKEFGVPASVITAFWELESDFGSAKSKKFSKVIDDYIRYRERDHQHGKTSSRNAEADRSCVEVLAGVCWAPGRRCYRRQGDAGVHSVASGVLFKI